MPSWLYWKSSGHSFLRECFTICPFSAGSESGHGPDRGDHLSPWLLLHSPESSLPTQGWEGVLVKKWGCDCLVCSEIPTFSFVPVTSSLDVSCSQHWMRGLPSFVLCCFWLGKVVQGWRLCLEQAEFGFRESPIYSAERFLVFFWQKGN